MMTSEVPPVVREFIQKQWGVSRIDTFKAVTKKAAFPIEFKSLHLEADRVLIVHRIVYLDGNGVKLGTAWKVSDFLTGRYINKTSYPTVEVAQQKGIAEAGAKLRAMEGTIQWSRYETPNRPLQAATSRMDTQRGQQLSFLI